LPAAARSTDRLSSSTFMRTASGQWRANAAWIGSTASGVAWMSAIRGVSVDLGREFARRLGVPVQLLVFATANESVEAVRGQQADLGFFAIDPKRGEGIAFTAAYVLIEGAYLVKDASPLTANEQVDRAGHRVLVGKGSAYDLYLTRELKQAEIVRVASSQAVVDDFVAGDIEVAAGVKQQLEADAARHPGCACCRAASW
jgi:polar amino acid transport system substrate-binding protein